MAALLPSCNTYNPNLGAAPAQTSGLSLLTPAAKPAASGDFTLTVNGIGFTSSSTVMWNNGNHVTPLTTTFVNSAQLTASVAAALIAQPAPFTINVTSPPLANTPADQIQGNNSSNYIAFCVNPPAATITQLSPPNATSGGAAFTLTVTGTGFLPVSTGNGFTGSVIVWNGLQLLTTFVSSTQLTTQIAASNIVATGSISVQVVLDPGPCPVRSNTQTFQINAPPPAAVPATAPGATVSSARAGALFTPAITSGSRFVAFVAMSADPATDAGVGVDRVFLRDTCTGAAAGCAPQTSVVSVGLSAAAPDGASRSPSISADGRFVAFASDADNLVIGDGNGVADIFLRDTCTGAPAACVPSTVRLSVGPDGVEANGPSDSPSIGADGRFVAFDSAATDLTTDSPAAGAANAVFLRDTCSGATGSCSPSTTRLTISATP